MTDKLEIHIYPSRIAKALMGCWQLVVICAVSIANHRYGGGSVFIDALAVFLFFLILWLASTTRPVKGQFFGTREQAIEFLSSREFES